MHKYKVGDKVRDFYDRSSIGEVTEIVDENGDRYDVSITWDRDYDVSIVSPSEVVPYDPEGDKLTAARAQEKIDEATHSLEAAFKAWAAAQNEYADREGQDVAYSMKQDELIDLKDFEGILNQNGWSTSSLFC